MTTNILNIRPVKLKTMNKSYWKQWTQDIENSEPKILETTSQRYWKQWTSDILNAILLVLKSMTTTSYSHIIQLLLGKEIIYGKNASTQKNNSPYNRSIGIPPSQIVLFKYLVAFKKQLSYLPLRLNTLEITITYILWLWRL